MDVRQSGLAEKQSLERPGAAASSAGRIHVSVETEDAIFSAGDWVFPSFKLKGQQPRVANMLVEDYLRPAAVKCGYSFIAPRGRRQTGR